MSLAVAQNRLNRLTKYYCHNDCMIMAKSLPEVLSALPIHSYERNVNVVYLLDHISGLLKSN